MRRFLVFRGEVYYPGGGMNDFEGDFDSKEAAYDCLIEKGKEAWTAFLEDEDLWYYQWGHIWDSETQTKVVELGR